MRFLRPVFSAAKSARLFSSGQRVCLVDGVRTPFQMSGTGYNELMAVDLGRLAIRGLLDRNPQLDPGAIDNVLMGTVIQECKTSNIAREAALSAGIPDKVPAFTVTLACISSNVAMSNASNLIKAGQADIVIASGTETMSDVPIRYSKKMRKVMLASQKSKSALKTFTMFWNAKSELMKPELPAIAEFSTNETMGHSADRLASMFNVTREEQDQFALRSHHNGAKALQVTCIRPLHMQSSDVKSLESCASSTIALVLALAYGHACAFAVSGCTLSTKHLQAHFGTRVFCRTNLRTSC